MLIILILLLIGAFPSWPYSRGSVAVPERRAGPVMIIMMILLVMGRVASGSS